MQDLHFNEREKRIVAVDGPDISGVFHFVYTTSAQAETFLRAERWVSPLPIGVRSSAVISRIKCASTTSYPTMQDRY